MTHGKAYVRTPWNGWQENPIIIIFLQAILQSAIKMAVTQEHI